MPEPATATPKVAVDVSMPLGATLTAPHRAEAKESSLLRDVTDRHDWHVLPVDAVVRRLEVDPQSGLTEAQVAQRQLDFGANRLTPRPGPTGWILFTRQLHQPLVYVLGAAAVVSGIFGGWLDAVVILVVVLLNALVGSLQEKHAGNAIAALKGLVTSDAHVRRDGTKRSVPASQLVPGDIVLLQPGDRIAADLRLTEATELHVDESMLTGESVPVAKKVGELPFETVLADRRNLGFAGTFVIRGHGEGVVWATGDRTETGRIAHLIAVAGEVVTPLTAKLAHFSRHLVGVIMGLAAMTLGWGLIRGESVLTMMMGAVSLAVGAIPEGLPAAVTIVLAIGVNRMARRNAIIRRLAAVETLGSATVICSDKTGTLTENAMCVREILAGGELFNVTGTAYAADGAIQHEGAVAHLHARPALEECLRAGMLCNEAQINRGPHSLNLHGDPTEIALLVAGERAGLGILELQRKAPRIAMIPFGSAHMFRATLHEADGKRVVYLVGAVDRVMDRCTHALDANGRTVRLDHDATRRIVTHMAKRGLRVLALARREMPRDHAKLVPTDLAEGLTLLGVQAMIDPPRAEVAAAVRRCQNAGIEVKMITGDHLITARTIAGQVGLLDPRGAPELPALSGRDLADVSDATLPDVAARTVVFARVSPEQKFRLVKALQSRGHVVAVTGDGVNDAPALKQANIGIAMGRSGTEVAKAAADLVLADDNFESIEAAVEEGRGVFDNLVKFLAWIIPTNLSEALLLIVAMAMNLPLPVLPLQLLWINLTDTLLGLPLAFEPKEHDLMQRPPRDPRQPLLSVTLWLRSGYVSVIMLAGTLSVFAADLHGPQPSLDEARTAVVNVIVLCEIAYLFNCRSLRHACVAPGFLANRWCLAGAAAMLGAQFLFTYSPVMNRLFHSAPLPLTAWLHLAVVPLVLFVAVEIEKWLRRRIASPENAGSP
jgi:magnesium-transporting ATPase (P-type)